MSKLEQFFSAGGTPIGSAVEAPTGFTHADYVEANGQLVSKSLYPDLAARFPIQRPNYNSPALLFTAANATANVYTTDFAIVGTRVVAIGIDTVSGGGPRIWSTYSDDEGLTWSLPALIVAAAGQAVYSSTLSHVLISDGTSFNLFINDTISTLVHYSSADGVSWSKTVGSINWPVTISPINKGVYSASMNKFIIASNFYALASPAGAVLGAWTASPNSGAQTDLLLLAPDGSVIMEAANSGMSRTTDGVTWTACAIDTPPTGNNNPASGFIAGNGIDLFVGTFEGQVLKSTDNGLNWATVRATSALSSAGILHDKANNYILLPHASAQADLYSDDGGVTWKDLSSTGVAGYFVGGAMKQLSTSKVILSNSSSFHNGKIINTPDLANNVYIPPIANTSDTDILTFVRIK